MTIAVAVIIALIIGFVARKFTEKEPKAYGIQKLVKNKNHEFGERNTFIHVAMLDMSGKGKNYLMTPNELERMRERAKHNTEDYTV